MSYILVFEKSATGWGAYVPDLPGVIATGQSRKVVSQLIREAIELHLEGLKEDQS